MSDWRNKRNPDYNKWILPDGYKDLGWQLYSGNSQEIKACHESKHAIRFFDNSAFMYRSTDRIHICDECKHVWHIDSSD